MKSVYVFGHKNPDTDSVCSAIAMAYLKNQIGIPAVPKVIGSINPGTKFVLDYFGVDAPSYLNDVKLQIKDINFSRRAYISDVSSIDKAVEFLKDNNLTACPLVDASRKVTGYLTLGDIAKYLVSDKRDNLKTNLRVLLSTLNAKILTNFQTDFEGIIQTVTFSSDAFINEVKLDEKTILIVGDRYKVLEHAIDSKVQLIILTRDRLIPPELLKRAEKNKVNVITSSYSSFELCNKLCLCNYVKNIEHNKNPYILHVTDYYSDFLNIYKKYNFTNYPVVNAKGECLGSLRIVEIGNYEKKKVMLVDHNNYEQSIEGLTEADILEIIDHHNLGSIGTNNPISFISRPVGCTATIIYEEFKKEGVKIPKDIAGLLLSAIISDTLLFTSPTTTDTDKKHAYDLAKLAKVDVEEYGLLMLKEACSIKGLSIDELIKQDFKSYKINDKNYGIAVITTMDFDEIKKDMNEYVKKLNEIKNQAYEAVIIFITDIIKEGSYVIYNTDCKSLVENTFDIENLEEGYFIEGCVSRKKQIIPALMQTLE